MKLYFTSNIVECPVCKSQVNFKSGETNIKVCGVCNSAIERLEGQGLVKIIGLQVSKKSLNSTIQIGSTGQYKGNSFEVIGCLHCDFERYFSNRFTILFTDGKTSLLTETEGFYSFQEKIISDFPTKLPTVRNIDVGTESIDLMRGQHLYVFDKANCVKSHFEGEILLMDNDGIFTSIELGDTAGNRFELVELHRGYFELYTLDYISYDELSFSNLPPINNQPLEVACDKCGKQINIKLPQYSQHCACPHCQGWNEIVSSNKLTFRSKNFSPYKPDLPIGTKGNIKGILYEVVGACIKNEAGSIDTFWREYTLYNRQQGFAFLAEYNGHFTYLKEVKLGSQWPAYKEELEVDGEVFYLFNDYGFHIKSAVGEFLTPLSGGSVLIREYIAPPFMYSCEIESGKELVWFKGEFISNTDVFEGLGMVDKSMPPVIGVGPLQTMKMHANKKFLMKMSIAAVLLFFVVELFFEFNAKQQIVYQNTFTLPDSALSKGVNTTSFELEKTSSNLQFTIGSPVNNSWFEAAITMVNDKNGTEYNFEKGVEYYYGYTSGENWKEGSQEDDIILSSIPKGKYHLNIFPSFGNKVESQTFTITVVNDVPSTRNFFIIILILLVYPLVMWWRNQSFEQKRWNNSAYNPYKKEEDE
jgi:Zn finger protein HypA/HybF involved in hydrogenase expression